MKISKESRKRRLWIVFKVLIVPIFFLIIIVAYLFNFFFDLFVPQKQQNNSETYIETEIKDDKKELEKVEINPVESENDIQEESQIPSDNLETPEITTPEEEIPPTSQWWEYPENITETTKSGDDLLVLVNKQYRLPASYSPKDLVDARNSGIRTKGNGLYYLRNILINNLKSLNDAAKNNGVDLSVISAYRSYATQESTYNYWVNYNGGDVAAADTVSARPGHSQHQLGTAVDFSSSEIGDRLGSEFDNTQASRWLENNAYKYGFVIAYPKGYEKTTKYSYESWHYRYIGVENASEMHISGDILENFLNKKI